MQVIPTLLTTNNDEFVMQMELFQKYYSRIQLDIADGILVPNKTTQIDDMITLFSHNRTLFKSNVTFDFHLMVTDFHSALKKINKLQDLGMSVNAALINTTLNPDIESLSTEYEFNIGLDVFPEDTTQRIARHYNLNSIKSIQVMTVNPGFQGSPFLEDMLTKIEQLRMLNYKSEIMIDGGVNNITIPIIQGKKYIPDFLCIGSYLTKAGDKIEDRVKELNNL